MLRLWFRKFLQYIHWLQKQQTLCINHAPIELVEVLRLALVNQNSEVKFTWSGDEVDGKDNKNPVVYFILSYKFLKLKNAQDEHAYERMAIISNWIANELFATGFQVVPTINYCGWNEFYHDKDNRYVSWHSYGNDINHLRLKLGSFPNHVCVDNSGFSGWANFAHQTENCQTLDKLDHTKVKLLKENLLCSKSSKYSQGQSDQEVSDSDFIFFPLQVRTDKVASLAFIKTDELLSKLVYYANNNRKKLVVKRHPNCRDRKIDKLLQKLVRGPYVVLSSHNVHDLIAKSRVIVTVNSGVGAEALLHDKPVITTGRSDYTRATTLVKTYSELQQAISKSYKIRVQPDHSDFLASYLSEYMVGVCDSEGLSKNPSWCRFTKKRCLE